MAKSKQTYIYFFLIISGIIHSVVLLPYLNLPKIEVTKNHRFKLNQIRTVGKDSGVKDKLLFIEKLNKKQIKKKTKLESLAFKDLPILENEQTQSKTKKVIKSLDINSKAVKQFLKSSRPGYLSPSQALQAMSQTDVNITLEVPKGIKEDELNKYGQVYYGFQRRTVLAYINSFQKELNSFERKNPHLRFPLTKDEQKLAGRVIYDKNGDILKIESLQWSQIKRLQGFFMKVLQNMSSLPNPPKEILENDQFAINFVLTINK